MILINHSLIYFSPTFTTKRIVGFISGAFAEISAEYDITVFNAEREPLSFGKDDFVIVGIPVYSGRVPALAKKIIAAVKGSETPAALIAAYGNRDYNDSLLELKTIVQSNGFRVIAAAAFVTEHSVVQKYGTGRPNEEDIEEIRKFAERLAEKLTAWDAANHTDLFVKGNPVYRKYKTIPIKPHATSLCVKCGICAADCPASAIPPDNPKKTIKSKCVTCVRCIRICPKKARCFYPFEKFFAEKSLEKLCAAYKRPEIFM